jgi:hypothetical protein
MAETLDVMTLSVQLNGSLNTGTAIMPVLPAAYGEHGGGFTLLRAQFQAGTTTGAGTAYTLKLVHGGSAGTVLGGTVSDTIGGTASVFASDGVYPFALTGTLTFAAGDSLAVQKVASGVNQSPAGILTIQYINGR